MLAHECSGETRGARFEFKFSERTLFAGRRDIKVNVAAVASEFFRCAASGEDAPPPIQFSRDRAAGAQCTLNGCSARSSAESQQNCNSSSSSFSSSEPEA